MELRNGLFFFSRFLRSRLGGLAVTVLTCFLLVGMVASTCGGIRVFSRSLASTGGFSPFPEPWVPVYLVSWALFFGAIASVTFRLWQLRCPTCSSHPSPALFSSNSSFVGVDGGVSSGFCAGVRLWAFSLLGIQLGLVSFYPSG